MFRRQGVDVVPGCASLSRGLQPRLGHDIPDPDPSIRRGGNDIVFRCPIQFPYRVVVTCDRGSAMIHPHLAAGDIPTGRGLRLQELHRLVDDQLCRLLCGNHDLPTMLVDTSGL